MFFIRVFLIFKAFIFVIKGFVFLYIKFKGGQVEIFILCLLGLVQGLCEFLPISSSGHLVLLSQLFGVEDSLFVSIVLHVATLLAVLVVFRKDILFMLKHPFSPQSMDIIIATIPTCIIVLILMPIVDASFGGGYLAFSFLISACLLLFSQNFIKKKAFQGTFTYKNALIMGIAQGLAVFPGISRSGTTLCAGLLSGGERKQCAKFSFLMSVPIIILSMLMELIKIFLGGQKVVVEPIGMILSFLIAFFVGIISIKVMLKLTERANFKWFSLYLFALAVITICVI